MNKILIGIGILGILVGVLYYINLNALKRPKIAPQKAVNAIPSTSPVIPSNTPTTVQQKEMRAVFLPSWAEVPDVNELLVYDRVYLFGLSANTTGLITTGSDAKQLFMWSQQLPAEKKWIVVKMTNADINLEVLKNPQSWKSIADDVQKVVTEQRVAGVVLDLEVSALSSESLVNQISAFVLHVKESLGTTPLALTMYGDAYYRKRPYNVAELAKIADEIIIMAYDMHKSRGESGPNFPLSRGTIYSYDFQTMIQDFLRDVPISKLSIAYGMYGYDWLVDEQKRPIRPAKSLSVNEIQKTFIDSCQWQNCIVRRDDLSSETEINYIDESNGYHIVWFEDKESAQ